MKNIRAIAAPKLIIVIVGTHGIVALYVCGVDCVTVKIVIQWIFNDMEG